MRLDEALLTAIESETRVRDHYLSAVDRIRNKAGRRVFELLAGEEQGHIDYLLACLGRWRREGVIGTFSLMSVMLPAAQLAEAIKPVTAQLPSPVLDDERQILNVALNLEQETSDYYRRLVAGLEGEKREFFARFLEIEDGHVAVVQAEIDSLSSNGCWFDFSEFNQEY